MPSTTVPLAVSSWSLHRALGLTYPNRPDNDVTPQAEPTYGEGRIDLLAMPAEVAKLGIHREFDLGLPQVSRYGDPPVKGKFSSRDLSNIHLASSHL